MIPYDPDGEHKGMDLTGWWVMFRDGEIVKLHTYEKDGWYSWPFHVPGETDWGHVHSITHLLGIDQPKRLHPQQVADLWQADVRYKDMTGTCSGNAPMRGWYVGSIPVDGYRIETYDPSIHKTEYKPRPIYRPESEK